MSINQSYPHYQYNNKELTSDFDLDWYDYGARWYDAAVGRFTSVDPLAEKYSFQSPYAYATNNPVLLRDIMGMGVEDIIFKSLQNDGSYAEIGRITTNDEFDEIIYLDRNIEKDYGIDLSSDPITVNGTDLKSNPYHFNTQAISLDVTGSLVVAGGAKLQLSIVAINKGKNKGDWGILGQSSVASGFDVSISGSVSFYQPNGDEDLRLKDLGGLERGISVGALMWSGSMFEGRKNFGGDGWVYRPINFGYATIPYFYYTGKPDWRTTYTGFSIGLGVGVTPVSGTVSGGYSDYLYKSNK